MFIITLQALIIFAVIGVFVSFGFKAVRGDYDRGGSVISYMERSLR